MVSSPIMETESPGTIGIEVAKALADKDIQVNVVEIALSKPKTIKSPV